MRVFGAVNFDVEFNLTEHIKYNLFPGAMTMGLLYSGSLSIPNHLMFSNVLAYFGVFTIGYNFIHTIFLISNLQTCLYKISGGILSPFSSIALNMFNAFNLYILFLTSCGIGFFHNLPYSTSFKPLSYILSYMIAAISFCAYFNSFLAKTNSPSLFQSNFIALLIGGITYYYNYNTILYNYTCVVLASSMTYLLLFCIKSLTGETIMALSNFVLNAPYGHIPIALNFLCNSFNGFVNCDSTQSILTTYLATNCVALILSLIIAVCTHHKSSARNRENQSVGAGLLVGYHSQASQGMFVAGGSASFAHQRSTPSTQRR